MEVEDFFSEKLVHTWRSFWEPGAFWQFIERFPTSFSKFSLGTIFSDVPAGVYLENRNTIFIGKNCIIEPGATIQGPCVIEDRCTVRQSAYIREHSYIGPESTIGHGTEIVRSFLFYGVKAAHFAYIGDSLVGEGVNFGAGVKCANVRLDQREVILHLDGKRYPTGRKKFGSLIGDFVQIGCNCVLNPGSFVQKKVQVPALREVRGTLLQKNGSKV